MSSKNQSGALFLFLGFTSALYSESDGGQPQMYWCLYAVLEWENDTKFHVFVTKRKANT
jgi:hypothetical protein